MPHRPGEIVRLVNLAEIHERWGISHWSVYKAVAERRIRAYGREGRQPYYSEAEVIAEFGEPGERTMKPYAGSETG